MILRSTDQAKLYALSRVLHIQMGFFLTCFGFSKKRKRRKSVYTVLKEGKGNGTYEALMYSSSNNLDKKGSDTVSKSNFGQKFNEQTVKIRKKVRFNLEVKTYEPITADCDDDTSNEEESQLESITGFCQNHRYYNCRTSYDEAEDDPDYEESDLDDPDFEDCEYYFHSDDDHGDDYDSVKGKEYYDADDDKAMAEVLSKKICDSSANYNVNGQNHTQAATERDQKSFKSGGSDVDNKHLILTSIENLSQWKAIKAQFAQSGDRRKDNLISGQGRQTSLRPSRQTPTFQSKPALAEFAVDASLSSWLNPMN